MAWTVHPVSVLLKYFGHPTEAVTSKTIGRILDKTLFPSVILVIFKTLSSLVIYSYYLRDKLTLTRRVFRSSMHIVAHSWHDGTLIVLYNTRSSCEDSTEEVIPCPSVTVKFPPCLGTHIVSPFLELGVARKHYSL